MTQFDRSVIERIRALMRKNAILPCIVKTENEAIALTRNDPCGHEWRVGEGYYRAETLTRTIPIRTD